MIRPDVQLACVGNVFTRMMVFANAGDIEQGHAHPFDHATLLASGAIRLTVEGCARDFKAPILIYIPKDKKHELKALEANTVVACIHALRDEAGTILPENVDLPTQDIFDLTEHARNKE
jgi:quercetin dioxygenase-like cupin family protein